MYAPTKAPANMPTIEEIIAVAGIHPARVKNIYLFGSQVYGTATEHSDFDFILTGSAQIAKQEFKSADRRINVHVHTHDIFKDELFKHDVHNLECFYAPSWAKLQIKEPYDNFVLNPDKVKQVFLSESWSSWTKAKMKINEGNIRYGMKSLWHSLRMLEFGIELVQLGKIVNWDIMNFIWIDELNNCDFYEWPQFKEKYLPMKLERENELKKATVLQC